MYIQFNYRHLTIKISTLITLLLFTWKIQAQSVHTLSDTSAYTYLKQGVSVLATCNETLDIETVSSDTYQTKFTEDLPYQEHCTHWLRLKLFIPQHLLGSYQLIQPNRGGRTTYYIPKADGTFTKLHSGLGVPPQERALNYPVYNNVPIELVKSDTITIFVELAFPPYAEMAGQAARLRILPFSVNDVVQEEGKFALLKMTIFVLLILGIYNLSVYFFTKDNSYLYYALTFIFLGPQLLQGSGYTWQWISISHIDQYDTIFLMFAIFGPLPVISYFQFSRYYLRDQSLMPKADKQQKRVIVIIAAILVLAIIMIQYTEGLPLLVLNIGNIALMAGFIYFFIHAIILAKKGSKQASYYIIATLSSLPFLIIYLLQGPGDGHYGLLGLISSTPFTRMCLNITVVVHALGFSIALAARINLLRHKVTVQQLEAEQAERKRLEDIKKVIEKKNQELEVKVEQRTQSLQEANEELRVSEENLSQLNKTKDHFFAVISHDLRGPVTSFQGISKILQHQIKKNQTDRVIQIMEQVDTSANQLNTLLDNLLQWAQSQLGGMSYRPESIRVNTLAEDIASTYADIAKAKQVEITLDIEPKTLSIWSDFPSTSAILRNLWGNALKFTENGQLSLISREENEHVRIILKDSGTGIPEEKLKTIFQIGNTKSSKGTQGEKGTGLGLVLCKEFAEKNGGSLSIESQVGLGTVVHLILPKSNSSL